MNSARGSLADPALAPVVNPPSSVVANTARKTTPAIVKMDVTRRFRPMRRKLAGTKW
jgi:hypothetical protein